MGHSAQCTEVTQIFIVKRLSDGQFYAMKKVKIGQLKPKEKENALNEVRILASINNPYVIQYKDAFICEEGSTLNVIMDLAEQGDLLKKIRHQQQTRQLFEEPIIWQAIYQIVSGLQAMHEMSVMHRDLKCANVFVQKEKNLEQTKFVLGDLNVSKVAKNGLVMTQTGTPFYASPEVWKDRPYDFKSDIWSLGCIIYEMCALKPPFIASDMQVLYKKICKGAFAPVPNKYSQELVSMVSDFLNVRQQFQVDPIKRPNCQQILISKAVQSRFGFINSLEKEEQGNDILLDTIRMPFNPKLLKDRLPQPKYKMMFSMERRKRENSQLTAKQQQNINTNQQQNIDLKPSIRNQVIKQQLNKQNHEKNQKMIQNIQENKDQMRNNIRQFLKNHVVGGLQIKPKSDSMTHRNPIEAISKPINDIKERNYLSKNIKPVLNNSKNNILNNSKSILNNSKNILNNSKNILNNSKISQNDSMNEIRQQLNSYLQNQKPFKRIQNLENKIGLKKSPRRPHSFQQRNIENLINRDDSLDKIKNIENKISRPLSQRGNGGYLIGQPSKKFVLNPLGKQENEIPLSERIRNIRVHSGHGGKQNKLISPLQWG